MIITERERSSSWWIELKSELEARLAKLRADNDKDSPAEPTAKLRGRIDEIKRLIDSLGMGKPKPKIEAE